MNAADVFQAPVRRHRGVAAALRTVFLAGLALWLAADVLRTAFFSLSSFGPLALLTDGVLHFRLGAALAILPLAGYLLRFSPGKEDPQAADEQRPDAPLFSLRRARVVMGVGAGLCALALVTLSSRVAWTFLAGVIAFLGALAPQALREPSTRRRRGLGWTALVLLIFFYLLAALAAWITTGYTIAPYPAPYPLPTSSRDERWRQDVRYLASELVRMHKNAYHSISPADFQARVRQLEADIPTLTDDQVAFRIIGIVAAVGDAHTSSSLPYTLKRHTYPVELRWFADGLYVTGAAAPYRQALGARVLAIGRLSAEQLDLAVQPLVSHENDYWAREQSPQLLRVAEALHTAGAVDDPAAPAAFRLSSAASRALAPLDAEGAAGRALTPLDAEGAASRALAPLDAEGTDGKEFTLEIAPVLGGGMQDMLSAFQQTPFFNSRRAPQWMEYRAKTHTLYFRYAACVDPTGFKKLMGELWRVVDTQPVDRLIVDLRGNGGGATIAFDTWFVPEAARRPQINRPERLFVLIDNGTFSSAADNAVSMQTKTRATFAGEPTGGKPNSYGELRYITLPNSKMRVNYSIKYFQMVSGDPPSLLPDRSIPLTARDAFAGKDPVLEAVAPGEEW